MESQFIFNPIGVIHTSRELKFDAPHQPEKGAAEESLIELFGGNNFEQALKDLAGFDYIWLIWWFHRNKNWKPMVMPPRGAAKRRGVFATRAPHRPNPIGITAVPLLKIRGRKIWVGANDLINGTPILDIKPYISSIDSFPNAAQGWLDEVNAAAGARNFEVAYTSLAGKQLEWLESKGINFIERAEKVLAVNPAPHRTRRITKLPDEKFRMGCGAWRIFFSVHELKVTVERIEPGYPTASLKKKGAAIPQAKEQQAFNVKFGSGSENKTNG